MKNNYPQTIKTYLRFFLSVFAILFLLTNEIYADDSIYKKGARTLDSYDSVGSRCHLESLAFMDPMSTDNNADYIFEADNPICYAWLAGSFAVYGALYLGASVGCGMYASSSVTSLGYSPAMAASIIAINGKCVALTATVGAAAASPCCYPAVASTIAAFAAPLISLAAIWTVANDAQKYARICGTGWNVWERDAKSGEWALGKGIAAPPNSSRQAALESQVKSGNMEFKITNKDYREYIYGGVEVEDNGSTACPSPAWSSAIRTKILGYDAPYLRYYFRGPRLSPNFACDRFLLARNNTPENIAEGRKAFSCCNKRSQNTMCIESDNSASIGDPDRQFCTLGSRCNVNGVWYDVYDSKVQSNYLCAKTYSVCPYNHPLGGGTETFSKDLTVNNCQFLKHCIKKPDMAFVKTTNLDGAYISSACFDLKGDSQNDYEYNQPILAINTKRFSAPMAQCFKETMENIFLNKAGTTKCKNPDESPDQNDVCPGGYIYKKGVVTDNISFFEKLQANVRSLIQITLTMAITILGINILMGGKALERKEIAMFLIKIALVMYFALGTAWQTTFFDGVFNSGMVVAEIVMRPNEEGKTPTQLDGCQFPRWNYADLSDPNPNNYAYPPGKQYLRIWDVLDCKLARAMGFGPEVSVPNIVLMILAGFFTFGAGIVFFVGAFIFAFFLLSLIIRAMHIFLLSAISIVLLVYISPITITCALFKRTEQIYKKWQSNLIGIIFQPVILFAYLGILITVFDKTMIGDVTFRGDGKSGPKRIICDAVANNNSIYCIFRIADVQHPTDTNLDNLRKVLGINIPMLLDMNKEKIGTILKAAFLMYVFGEILGQIPRISVALVGGAQLPGKTKSAADMAKASFGVLSAIQKRGKRAAVKHAPKIASGAMRVPGVVKNSKLVQEIVSKRASVGGLQGESKIGAGGDLAGVVAPPLPPRPPAAGDEEKK